MKKLLGAALALALVFPSGPASSAELLKNLKVSGGLDLQHTSGRNVVDFVTRAPSNGGAATNNDRLATTATRVVLGLGWDLLDDVHAKVTLRKNDRPWGNVGTGGQGAGAQGGGIGNQAIDGGGALGNTYINEAYVKIDKLFGSLDSTFGRQFWGEPGDLIAFWGPKNAYGLPVTAIDAVSVMGSWDWFDFAGIVGQNRANAIGTVASGGGAVTDQDVRGINLGIKPLPIKTSVFLWNVVTHNNGALGNQGPATTGLNDNLWVYGLKIKGEAMGGWAGLTLASNGGQNRTGVASSNYIGKAALLDLGYKADISGVGGLTPWFNWGWGSGRHDSITNKNETFMSVASDYRPGVIYGRFNSAGLTNLGSGITGLTTYDGVAGVASPGLSNRLIWGGGLKFNPSMWSKLGAGVSYWNFNYANATRAGTVAPVARGNRHIGSEIDFQVDWAHSENVGLSAGWATFQPGGFIKETIRAAGPAVQQGNNPATLVFADLNIKF